MCDLNTTLLLSSTVYLKFNQRKFSLLKGEKKLVGSIIFLVTWNALENPMATLSCKQSCLKNYIVKTNMFNNISICIERMDFSNPLVGRLPISEKNLKWTLLTLLFLLTVLVYLTYQIYRNTARIIIEILSCPSLRFQKY